MTDELMLFLALAGGFTVVLVEWWVRQNDGYRDPCSEQRKSNDRGEADTETNPPLVEGNVRSRRSHNPSEVNKSRKALPHRLSVFHFSPASAGLFLSQRRSGAAK